MKRYLKSNWLFVAFLVWYAVHVVFEATHGASLRYAFFGIEPAVSLAADAVIFALLVGDAIASRKGSGLPPDVWSGAFFIAAALESAAIKADPSVVYFMWAEIGLAVIFAAATLVRRYASAV